MSWETTGRRGRQVRTMAALALLMLGGGACIPAGGGGGGGGGSGGEATDDMRVDPDDGIPGDMFVDPDDGIPADMFVDPDDGIPADMFVDPDDGIPPPDGGCRPAAEACNGADDDCDGTADEDFPALGEMCAIGEGLCEASGVVVCTPDGGGTVCGAMGAAPAEELCNGLDDDCDGAVDEAIEPRPCDTGVVGRCRAGLEQCVGGESLCIPQLDPRGEVCDGQDDDCDGFVDEEIELGFCQSGLPGNCAEGVGACEDGAVACVAPAPQGEVCGGGDEDCDGRADEGGVCDACRGVQCPAGRVCVDGECVFDDPCVGVRCPPGTVCDEGDCVPVDPGGATPIAAAGGSIELIGALDEDDPIWQRLGQACAGRSAGGFHFDALRVVNLTGAPRLITVTGNWVGADGYLHVFTDAFDPAADAGCLGGDDDFGNTDRSQVAEVPIGPGEVRVLVVSTYGAGATMESYRVVVETAAAVGPGEVCDDEFDNDGNGLTDCDDAACAGDPACVPPECVNYWELADAARSVDNGAGAACDGLDRNSPVHFGQWHRLVEPAGTRMPTAPPPVRRCGTDAPGWLNGEHPRPEDGDVERTVCFNWDGDQCNWQVDIRVRNCGDFYVYLLFEAPSCRLVYCAE